MTKARIDTYADLLAILDDIQGQCAEAKDSYNQTGTANLEELWMHAANAVTSAINQCEYARDQFMAKVPAKS